MHHPLATLTAIVRKRSIQINATIDPWNGRETGPRESALVALDLDGKKPIHESMTQRNLDQASGHHVEGVAGSISLLRFFFKRVSWIRTHVMILPQLPFIPKTKITFKGGT